MDNIHLRYGLRPLALCLHCNGCGEGFSIEHALSCKKGGLVTQRHDDARDEAGNLAPQALIKERISYKS